MSEMPSKMLKLPPMIVFLPRMVIFRKIIHKKFSINN